MSIARKREEQPQGAVQKKVHHIMETLTILLSKISKANDYPALQEEMDRCAKEIISIIGESHSKIVKIESYLKNALIDLTEIPHMQPEMQKIAFQVGIKAAIDNLKLFIDHSEGV